MLHAITQTLTELELDISLSKISTEGEKVADVFYVSRSSAGRAAKITDPAELARIDERLRAALVEP